MKLSSMTHWGWLHLGGKYKPLPDADTSLHLSWAGTATSPLVQASLLLHKGGLRCLGDTLWWMLPARFYQLPFTFSCRSPRMWRVKRKLHCFRDVGRQQDPAGKRAQAAGWSCSPTCPKRHASSPSIHSLQDPGRQLWDVGNLPVSSVSTFRKIMNITVLINHMAWLNDFNGMSILCHCDFLDVCSCILLILKMDFSFIVCLLCTTKKG